MEDIKTTFKKLANNVSPFIKEKYTISEMCKDLVEAIKYAPEYYAEQLEELNRICELKNQVAALSSNTIADELTYVIKQIAYTSTRPNSVVICEYLEEAIEDLLNGVDKVDVLWKYDEILYKEKHM